MVCVGIVCTGGLVLPYTTSIVLFWLGAGHTGASIVTLGGFVTSAAELRRLDTGREQRSGERRQAAGQPCRPARGRTGSRPGEVAGAAVVAGASAWLPSATPCHPLPSTPAVQPPTELLEPRMTAAAGDRNCAVASHRLTAFGWFSCGASLRFSRPSLDCGGRWWTVVASGRSWTVGVMSNWVGII